jgi:hypothetical protein
MQKNKRVELALLVCAALGMTMVASAASAAMGWTQSSWASTTFGFTVDARPIGGKLRTTTLTRVNSTTNRTTSSTGDTFHAVSNFCVNPVTGSAAEQISGFVGNANGASLNFTCSGGGTTSWVKGWIWSEQ